ncbi:MAG: virulence RhuM family protein [Acidobacteria bacterium]|nr:virulence RhuM family protein [Acidobacteriota bacterium]
MQAASHSSFLLYTGSDGSVNVSVLVQDETVWITQEAMQQLFGRVKSTISEHISNVFSEKELDRDSVVRNFRTTAADRKSYHVQYFNLDVIISVGYRVKSPEGTRFRIWATRTLREFKTLLQFPRIRGNWPTPAPRSQLWRIRHNWRAGDRRWTHAH